MEVKLFEKSYWYGPLEVDYTGRWKIERDRLGKSELFLEVFTLVWQTQELVTPRDYVKRKFLFFEWYERREAIYRDIPPKLKTNVWWASEDRLSIQIIPDKIIYINQCEGTCE